MRPNEGRIYLDDEDITKAYLSAARGYQLYLAQEESVFRKMERGGQHHGGAGDDGAQPSGAGGCFEKLIDEFGLEKVRRNYGDRLSVGSVDVWR